MFLGGNSRWAGGSVNPPSPNALTRVHIFDGTLKPEMDALLICTKKKREGKVILTSTSR